jgi:hypothetical protein
MAPDSKTGKELRVWSIMAGMRPLGFVLRKEGAFC